MKKFFICICFTLQILNSFGQTLIEKRLQEFEHSPFLEHAVIGFELVDIQNDSIIAAINNYKALSPASVQKIVTTASALELLGEDFQFQTFLCLSGEMDNKQTLHGNLCIIGGGDPTLGSNFFNGSNAFLQQWVTKLQSKGIQTINGKLLIDATCYGEDVISPKWLVEDIGNYYASGSYGLSLFDNTYCLTVKTGARNNPTQIINCNPPMEGFLTFTNHIQIGHTNNAYIEGLPNCYNRVLKGMLTANRDSIKLKGDIPNVPLFVERYLENIFAQNEIKIVGNDLPSHNWQYIDTVFSPSLSSIIRVTNFKSNNLFADCILKQIGFVKNKKKGPGTFTSGITAIQNFWKDQNIDLSPYTLYDGSGLAPANKISANAINRILIYMYNKSKHKDAFIQSLPKAGRDGTVADLIPYDPQKTFLLKSGSMGGIRAYSGYILKNGKSYCLTILCNNFATSGKNISKAIASLLMDISENL